ncbi:class I SAM-dependent methyltransferase [Streptomyces sp. NPDC060198]|uniref:class I SAM-dependent methyltransferase n=1 Tax=Streptomyces sp. NPDC060198 TaxID=3347070 RepID=UPI00364DFB30
MAADYSARFRAELDAKPLERALLAGFVDLVRETGGGKPLADVGCGTGRVTGHLHGLGADVFGIDLSPGMLAVARAEHPGLRFEEGSMLALDLPDGSLGGLLAWYSVIHITDALLPAVFAEFHRVLAPGAHVQLGFQAGDETRRRTDAWGRPIRLDFHRRRPEAVAALLGTAGFEPRVRTVREADTDGAYPEPTPQGFVLARKPVAERGGQSAGRADSAVRVPAATSSATWSVTSAPIDAGSVTV